MKTNMNFNLFTPTKLLFGCGKLNELGNQSMPGKKALLLISNGQSVRTTGTLDRTVAQLDKANAAHVLCANIHDIGHGFRNQLLGRDFQPRHQ